MIRRSLLALVCATLLSLVLGTSAFAAPTETVRPEWGSTSAPDGVLKNGCRTYHYGYSVDPPEGDWSLEIFISGPSGENLANHAFVVGADPQVGVGTYKLCKPTTSYGRFTLRALLSSQDSVDYVEGWLAETTFKLRKPRRR